MSEEDSPPKPEYVVPTAGHRGMTELHQAAYLNDPEAVRVELERGTSPDVRDQNGWTPLHWSADMAQAWSDPAQVVALLLAAGASPDAVDNFGRSVLMVACGTNNDEVVERLIEAGADVHLQSDGTTALHEAAGSNFVDGIRRLLSCGAKLQEVDERGRTPKDVAEECGFVASVELLRAARFAT